jgi:hypothetical protein
MDTDKANIAIAVVIILGILLIVGLCFGGTYYIRKISYENFQTTLKDLSPEQKCLYICSFTWNGVFEGYKLCVEKCDRISERLNTN